MKFNYLSFRSLLSLSYPHRQQERLTAPFLAVLVACSMVLTVEAQAQLLNVNFGAHLSPGLDGVKTGVGAIGNGPTDYWNFYSRDNADGSWRSDGVMASLNLADGTPTGIGLEVGNAPGSWANGSSDAMYNTYVYPLGGGTATFKLSNLAAGSYDLLVYSYDGNCSLTVGASDYGSRAWHDSSPAGAPVWQEGRQYARYSGISVGNGETLNLTMNPGQDGIAVISGLQLVSAVPEPSVAVLTLFAAAFVSWRCKSKQAVCS